MRARARLQFQLEHELRYLKTRFCLCEPQKKNRLTKNTKKKKKKKTKINQKKSYEKAKTPACSGHSTTFPSRRLLAIKPYGQRSNRPHIRSVCLSLSGFSPSLTFASVSRSLSVFLSVFHSLPVCAGHLSYLVRIEIIPVVYFYCCNYTSASQSGESSPEHSRSHRIYLSIVLFQLGNSALFGFCTIPSSSVTQSKYKKAEKNR